METEEDTKASVRNSARNSVKEPGSNSHNEGAQKETLLENAEGGDAEESKEAEEEEDSKEEEEKKKGRSANKRTSEAPTDKEVEKWIKENPFECDKEGCKGGKGGRPYRSKKMGGMNLHKWNTHGITAEGTKEGEKEKKKAGPKGEGDMVNEAIKRKEAAELKGKLTQTINRIIKLGTKQKEVLEPENSILKEWKRRCLQKDCAEEEIAFMQDELTSIISTIDELEKESKEAKKKKITKETKREEEDDDDDLLGYGDMKTELKTIRVRAAIDEAREEREAARRRRDREDERREEEHQMRMQAMKGGGGPFGGMGGNSQAGVIEEVIFKYDEEGNLLRDADGQPVAASIRRTPVNALALQGQGRGDGKSGELQMIKTIFDMTKGDKQEKSAELKLMKDQNAALIIEIRNMATGHRDKQIYGDMNKLAGAIDGIHKKLEEDPMDAYINMQDRMKQHNIYPDGNSSPEVKKIDLEIEREKTRRSTDLMMMNKTFKMAETAIRQVSDGTLAKAFARKIDQTDIIKPEEEEMPPDDEIEAEIEEELEQPEPPPEPPTTKKGGKHGKGKR